jgi:hypothetical protein
MKNGMKAIPGSLDYDLAFEAADVMIDEAGIMNGQAFIPGTQLLEHKSNLSQWPCPHLSNSSSRLIIYLTPRDPHVALAICEPIHHGVAWYAYIVTSFRSFSLASANCGPVVLSNNHHQPSSDCDSSGSH